jgi:hypothetical protein
MDQHPNEIRGPIEQRFNAEREQIETRHREAVAAADRAREEELRLNEASKQQAFVDAGLNPDGSVPTQPSPDLADPLAEKPTDETETTRNVFETHGTPAEPSSASASPVEANVTIGDPVQAQTNQSTSVSPPVTEPPSSPTSETPPAPVAETEGMTEAELEAATAPDPPADQQ